MATPLQSCPAWHGYPTQHGIPPRHGRRWFLRTIRRLERDKARLMQQARLRDRTPAAPPDVSVLMQHGMAAPRRRWGAPGLAHIRAGTRPHPRRDSPTSAPGLAHIRAGTRRPSAAAGRAPGARRDGGDAAVPQGERDAAAVPSGAHCPGQRQCRASASVGPVPVPGQRRCQRRCRASASAGPVPGRCRDVAAVPLGECSRHQKAAKLRVPLRVPFEYPSSTHSSAAGVLRPELAVGG